jgi:hypothetical protein
MKVKATLQTQPEEFDVELPLYRKHDVGGLDDVIHYERIEARGGGLRKVQVTVQHDYFSQRTWSLAIDDDYHFDEHSSPDHTLGRGEHASSEAEWNQALASLELVLADVSR